MGNKRVVGKSKKSYKIDCLVRRHAETLGKGERSRLQ